MNPCVHTAAQPQDDAWPGQEDNSQPGEITTLRQESTKLPTQVPGTKRWPWMRHTDTPCLQLKIFLPRHGARECLHCFVFQWKEASTHTHHSPQLFFSLAKLFLTSPCFICFRGRVTEKERETETAIFHPLVCSPKANNGRG